MKKKVMGMALVATMLLSMTGCGGNEAKNDDIEAKIDKMSEEEIEDAMLDYADEADAENNEVKTTEAVEEIAYEPTEQIINAEFNSGLVQINNDVFQQGGYITVGELFEQYSDKYDFEYEEGTYEEHKDYLVEYKEDQFYNPTGQHYSYENYKIILTPKYGNTLNQIKVYIVNMTNPDEKITLDKAQVLFVEPYIDKKNEVHTPLWTAKGFSSDVTNTLYWSKMDGLTSSDDAYNVQSLTELLTSKGYSDVSDAQNNPVRFGKVTDALNMFSKGVYAEIGYKDGICLYVIGEANLAGKQPIYKCLFKIDPNTDKCIGMNCSMIDFL